MDTLEYQEQRELLQEMSEKRDEQVLAIPTMPLGRLKSLAHELITYGGNKEIARQAAVMILERANVEMAKERQNGKKYARLARIFIPWLREIWRRYPEFKKSSSIMMNDMLMEQTQPLHEIDRQYAEIENATYEDVDSYTGEVFDSKPVKSGWDKDLDEVMQELGNIDYINGDRIIYKLPVTHHPIKRKANNQELVDTVAAWKELGYSEDQIEFLVATNFGKGSYQDLADDEDEWPFDDRGITSVPIKMGEEQVWMKWTPRLSELQERCKPYVQRIKDDFRVYCSKYQACQRILIDTLKQIRDSHGSDKEVREICYGSGEFANSWYREAAYKVSKGKTWKGLAWYELEKKMCARPPHDGVISYPKMWYGMAIKEIENSQELRDFLNYLKNISCEYEPQDVAIVFLSVQHFMPNDYEYDDGESVYNWGSCRCAAEIPVVGYENLLNLLEESGDDILEHILDPIPAPKYTTAQDIERWGTAAWQSYIKRLDPAAKDARHTPVFNQAFFETLVAAKDIKECNDAGWEAWRISKSPHGNQVFKKVLDKTGDMKVAWKAFYHTAKPVSAMRNKLVVQTANGQEEIGYDRAAWKYKNGELIIANPLEFKQKLEQAGYGKQLTEIIT